MRQNTFFNLRLIICKFLIVAFILSNFLGLTPINQKVHAQVPIVITADQPNVWTLEQAHYLLAQMHRRNLDLKAKSLTDLDANAINGVRLDVLKTLLEVGVEFSQEDLFNNRQAKSNTVFNNTRRQALIKRNDELQTQSLQLAENIAKLKFNLTQAQTEDEKQKINADIEQNTAIQTKVDKQIEFNNNELKTLNPSKNDVSDTTSDADFQKDKQGGLLDESFKAAAKKIIENADNPPKLNASLQLDNYLQLQYEIISKQLTLLRDEVGPGERVVFLELPQSINASYDKADNKWAQSWWKILGYTKTVCLDGKIALSKEIDCPSETRGLNRKPQSTTKTFESILEANDNTKAEETFSQYLFESDDILDPQTLVNRLSQTKAVNTLEEYLYDRFPESTRNLLDEYQKKVDEYQKKVLENAAKVPPVPTPEPAPRPTSKIIYSIANGLNYIISGRSLNQLDPVLFPIGAMGAFDLANPKSKELIRLNRKLIEQALGATLINPANPSIYKMSSYHSLGADVAKANLENAQISNRQIRTIELIPRQSSLNVNDIKLQNRSGVLNILASFLFGLGANVSYQRQHEQYSQFVQQELYSSAFGKGSREFGWTFTPMPGTDRLLSGVRTTYAILVVPQEATSIVVDTGGCYFKRSDRQPQNFAETNLPRENNSGCGEHKAFVLPIPGGGNESNSNDFYISGLAYRSVKKDKRLTVSIYGENFSSQIGVMVDGVPLKPSLGIAQPFIRDDSTTGASVKTDLAEEKVKGNFERIDAQQIVATFEVPEFEGTPTITLVAPGLAIDVNRLDNLYINGNRYTSLKDSDYMFGKKPSGKPELKIDNVDLFPTTVSVQVGFDTRIETRRVIRRINGRRRTISVPVNIQVPKFGERTLLTAFIYGDGLNGCAVYGNGLLRTQDPSSTAKLLNVPIFPVPLDETIKFSLVCGEDVKQSLISKNPFFKPNPNTPSLAPTYNGEILKIDKVTFISYEDSVLVVELEGKGFSENLKPSIGDLVVKSPTNAVLQIDPSKASQVVTFTDTKLNLFVKAIIARKTQEKPVTKSNQ